MSKNERARAVDLKEQTASRFIGHLHAFRGVAIMLIVLVHVAGISMYRLGTDPDMSDYMMLFAVFETIAHNGTIFFALISGLLYSTVLSGRSWYNFYRGKALNVILPYVFFSLIFTYILFSFLTASNYSTGVCVSIFKKRFTIFSLVTRLSIFGTSRFWSACLP